MSSRHVCPLASHLAGVIISNGWLYDIQFLLIVAAPCHETVTTSLYKFIKRYPIPLIAPRTIDVALKSVYVAARNLVFGLTCCHAPGFGLRLK